MSDWADDETMSAEETQRRFEALNPEPTTDPEDRYRELVVQRIAGAIWRHGFNESGTAVNGISASCRALAESIADVFTCTECGFLDAFIGNSHGECNDCAPRVAARKRAADA